MKYMESMHINNFIQGINEPIIVMDKEGIIHFKNDLAQSILSNINVEKQFRLLNSKMDWCYFLKRIEKSDTKNFHEVPVLSDTQQMYYINMNIVESSDKNMYLVRIISVSNEHQLSEQQSHAYNNLMNLFNEFKQAVVFTDYTGRIVAYNTIAENLLEFSNVNEPITNYEQIFDIFDYDAQDLINYYKNIGEKSLGELIISYKDKRENKNVKVYSLLYKDINVLISTFSIQPTNIHTKQDISTKFLGENTAKIMHEINNPLSTLKGYVEFMLSKQQFNLDYLNIISKEIKKIEMLSSELLFLANPREELYSIVSLTTLIEDCVNLLLIDVQKYNCQLEVQFQIEEDSYIFVNEVRIKQVIINIIKNGFEAIYDNQKPGVIQIYVSQVVDKYYISVIDNGPGIEKDKINQIFTPFYTTKSRGTGLGLSISKQIIEEHNGELVVESNYANGTVVTISLPVYMYMHAQPKVLANDYAE